MNFVEIVNHTSGVCIAKAAMSKFKDDINKVKNFSALISQHFDNIVQNPFGNYAVQFAI